MHLRADRHTPGQGHGRFDVPERRGRRVSAAQLPVRPDHDIDDGFDHDDDDHATAGRYPTTTGSATRSTHARTRRSTVAPVRSRPTAGPAVRSRLNAALPENLGDTLACSGQRLDCNGDVWRRISARIRDTRHSSATSRATGVPSRTWKTYSDAGRQHGGHHPLRALGAIRRSAGSTTRSTCRTAATSSTLLFANVFSLTTKVGSRVFDVAIEGQLVLDDFDQVAAAGGSGRVVNRSIFVDVTAGGRSADRVPPGEEQPRDQGDRGARGQSVARAKTRSKGALTRARSASTAERALVR